METAIKVSDKVTLAAKVWKRRKQTESDEANVLGVVLVHQWGKLGGCAALMEGMAKHFATRGCPALTFDLRGIGGSSGSSTCRGFSEIEDVVAACTYAKEVLKWSRLVLLGSSAGGPIAGSALARLGDNVNGYVGIAYVCGRITNIVFGGHIEAMVKSPVPKLLFHGDGDGFSSIYQVKQMMKDAERWRLEEVKGVGHFEIEGPAYDSFVVEKVIAWANEEIMGSQSAPQSSEHRSNI